MFSSGGRNWLGVPCYSVRSVADDRLWERFTFMRIWLLFWGEFTYIFWNETAQVRMVDFFREVGGRFKTGCGGGALFLS